MTLETFIRLLIANLNDKSEQEVTNSDVIRMLTNDGQYSEEEVYTNITAILDRPDGATRGPALIGALVSATNFPSEKERQDYIKTVSRTGGIFVPETLMPASLRINTGDNDWSEIISDTATIPVRSELPEEESESVSITESRPGFTGATPTGATAQAASDIPRLMQATVTDGVGGVMPLWLQIPNDENGNQQWVPTSHPTSSPLKFKKQNGQWVQVSVSESEVPLSQQYSGQIQVMDGAVYAMMKDGTPKFIGNETAQPHQYNWGTMVQDGKNYFIDRSADNPWETKIEIGDVADDFKAQFQQYGDQVGFFDNNNEWQLQFRIPDTISKFQQAQLDQSAADADAQRARDFMTAQQYDVQNQLTRASQQLQAAQQAQQARTSLAQLGLQAADQTRQDFLTFNEILNNPQSALSSMNWMRGAVDPTEENRFGESSPMDRLGQLNQARGGFNQYLNDLYSAQLQQVDMPTFNPGANAGMYANQSLQNFIRGIESAADAKAKEQQATIDAQSKIISGFQTPPPSSGAGATSTASQSPASPPGFTVSSSEIWDNPANMPLDSSRSVSAMRTAADRQRFFAEEARRRKEAEARAIGSLSGIGFRY
ncbi:MAG: hypothetical protein CME70_01575 [Halobacteriovorax sp.]|nr:hypothetical protein [Halobacteriovorax sp.]